jgi:fatty acid cis/trans isomerase CTI
MPVPVPCETDGLARPASKRAALARPALAVAWLALLALLAGACGPAQPAPAGPEMRIDHALLDTTPSAPLDFRQDVQPILEARCVVCHGCYDAPCQLKLSSVAGIERGGSKELVYDGARIKPADPTRLFIDALTTEAWRAKGFHPVLAEGAASASERLDGSVLYRMLRLKQLHPQPLVGMLDPSIDTSLDRKASCPTLDEFDEYAREHPRQGMPFGLPNLAPEEYTALVHWLAQGARAPPAPPPPSAEAEQIEAWERFLNGTSPKERLVARYLFEHLFLAHLHFEGSDPRVFFSLLRSRTPPGQPIAPIPTRRPYGDPGGPFFYRIAPVEGSIVAKDHLPYELSPARMARLRQLFIDPGYSVSELSGYQPGIAANPFRAFAALPVEARYRFLLDDARFFIEGFIKGPVCRGQVALNVVEDRFWILFFDPDAPLATNTRYIAQLANYLSQPTEMEDTLRLATTYSRYLELDNRYLEARRRAFTLNQPLPLERAVSFIWDGDGANRSAALTVYRHYDSASVATGLLGEEPETAWVLDYPLLERIHYLLVAGFDVYGNLGHQLNTRLFMDVLRMEAENYFLAFLPANVRKQTHDAWYTGIRMGDADALDVWWMNIELVTGYQTAAPAHELYGHVAQRLGRLAAPEVGRDLGACRSPGAAEAVASADRSLARLATMRGKVVEFLPNVAFLRVRMGDACAVDLAYTLIADKSYDNVSSMFSEERVGDRRDYAGDRQTVVPWLEGAYPEFFFVVDLADVERFASDYDAIETRADYERFVERFGIRRTNPRFWETSDWFNAQARRERPERAGWFDLNRYQNR